MSIPELPELPDDISKFSLFTREVELASEFTSLANMHKELDLSKFLQDESQIGRASDDVRETFEADNDTLHDLWLQSLNRENTKVSENHLFEQLTYQHSLPQDRGTEVVRQTNQR